MEEVEINHILIEARIIQHNLQNTILLLSEYEKKVGALVEYVRATSINKLREETK